MLFMKICIFMCIKRLRTKVAIPKSPGLRRHCDSYVLKLPYTNCSSPSSLIHTVLRKAAWDIFQSFENQSRMQSSQPYQRLHPFPASIYTSSQYTETVSTLYGRLLSAFGLPRSAEDSLSAPCILYVRVTWSNLCFTTDAFRSTRFPRVNQ